MILRCSLGLITAKGLCLIRFIHLCFFVESFIIIHFSQYSYLVYSFYSFGFSVLLFSLQFSFDSLVSLVVRFDLLALSI